MPQSGDAVFHYRMKAFLKNYRQSPRKVRLVTDLISQKDVKTARLLLVTASKRAALQIKKLLDSAVSNARQGGNQTPEENLFIQEVRVDEGPTMKRTQPRARGTAYVIRKRTSRVMLTLGERTPKKKESKPLKAKTLNPKP